MAGTSRPIESNAFREEFVGGPVNADYLIALAGNPNTGKSTVFNGLTGLNQHTGNWPGKTVAQARGVYMHGGKRVALIDLPGTYSLLARSPEEQIARDFICFAQPDATVVVADATCLQRNLNLVLQVAEITPRAILCLNLIDEARRKGIEIDHALLAHSLGVPVVPTVARSGHGLANLKDVINAVASGHISPEPLQVRYSPTIEREIERLEPELASILDGRLRPRWVALRLLDGDTSIISSIERYLGRKLTYIRRKVPA
ncbi:MAG: iron transporter FeoB [Firmicutes bacterium]|nr:iron transporter FeoB [Bacillota bacterium]